jgi:hypothetical protein
MEQKVHYAWPAFTGGMVPAEHLHVHLEQEYATYVRDFPVLVARAYVQCPIPHVRRELVENVYEEETGGIAAGKPHPELFLEIPRGLGMDLSRFSSIELLPRAQLFRDALDRATRQRGWEAAAAVTTIFLEGTPYERGEVDVNAKKRPEPSLEEHPLVRHYGLPIEALALTRAHRGVEGHHRSAAWDMMLNDVGVHARATAIDATKSVLEAWLRYRDEIAEACGIVRGSDGKPCLAA